MVLWLGFRLMYQAGAVKLTSGCPTWWHLTALDIHHHGTNACCCVESHVAGTCIPNAVAWFAHQMPHWVQALSVVATLVIEILMPFLFFVPTRCVHPLQLPMTRTGSAACCRSGRRLS